MKFNKKMGVVAITSLILASSALAGLPGTNTKDATRNLAKATLVKTLYTEAGSAQTGNGRINVWGWKYTECDGTVTTGGQPGTPPGNKVVWNTIEYRDCGISQ